MDGNPSYVPTNAHNFSENFDSVGAELLYETAKGRYFNRMACYGVEPTIFWLSDEKFVMTWGDHRGFIWR